MKADICANAVMNASHSITLPRFSGRQEDAVYQNQLVPAYQGNPLIEALPKILSARGAAGCLRRGEKYAPEMRRSPDEIRLQQIMNSVRFFEPLQVHLDLEQRISCMLRMGYVGRSPVRPEFWRTLNTQVTQLKTLSHDSQKVGYDSSSATIWPSSTPLGFSIVGITGIGKTLTVENILSLYPQVIYHSTYKEQPFSHVQIVWLKLDCPFDGSIKGLCLNFLAAVDQLLQTHYYDIYARMGRVSVDELLPRMARVAGLHSIGVMVVDEIQNLSVLRGGGWDKMLNFQVQLINTIGMPVLQIGTPKVLPVLQGEFRQARRGSGQGDFLWDRMPNDAVWRYFIEALWRYQYVRQDCPLTDELTVVLYEESQGITDFAVKLYFLAQIRAIRAHDERVTPETIRSVAEDCLKLARPILTALRTGDHEKLVHLNIDDLFPIDWQKELSNAATVSSLPTSSKAIAPSPGSKAQSQSQQKHRVMKDELHALQTNQLRVTIERGAQEKLSPYESLKKAGFVRPVTEFIAKINH